MKKIFLLILMPIIIYAADISQLFKYCEENNLEAIKKIDNQVCEGLKLKDPKNGFSLLTLAVLYQNIEMVEYFISKGANIRSKVNSGAEALHIACYLGNKNMVKCLVSKGANINALDKKLCTPLMVAVYKSDKSIVKYLLSKEATDIKLRNKNSLTAIDIAFNKCNLPVVDLFLKKLNVADKSKYINKGFFVAVKNGDLEAVEYFLSKGVDIESKDFCGKKALVIAVEYCDIDMIKFLLSKNARINSGNNYVISPIQAFCDMYCDAFAEFKNYNGSEIIDGTDTLSILFDVAKLLVSNGANINAKFGPNNTTVLHIACLRGDLALVKFLVSNGADTDMMDCYGNAPIVSAKKRKATDIIDYLESVEVNR